MAGRVGFYGFTDEFIVNRFFAVGHSHYFQPTTDDPDSFMREWWVPILANAKFPRSARTLATRGGVHPV
jgi:hypothetical protein